MILRASLTSFLPLLPLALLSIGGSGLFAACSSSPAAPGTSNDGGGSDGAACSAFVPPASFSPTSPTVSFTNDVFPIFETSCAFSSCHGSSSNPAAGMFLGADEGQVYANIVKVAATEYPSMVRVAPGDPANSYLLHRIDGDACTLPGCTSAACAESMPQYSPLLPEAQLLAIRGWIAQGALSDIPDAGAIDAGTAGDSGAATDAAPPEAGTDANDD
jgi:hypothetical protein